MAFFKTTVVLEILSERAINPESLHQIADEITSGDWSGSWDITSVEFLSADQMSAALIDQGSDPSFFGLDK